MTPYRLIAILVFCGLACGANGNGFAASNVDSSVDPALRVTLYYIKGENSKDSHSYRYAITLDGRKISLEGPYGACVRGQCERKTLRFKLTEAEQAALAKRVTAKAFLKPFQEMRRFSALGSYLTLTLMAESKGRKAMVSIAGMRTIWSKTLKNAEQKLSPAALHRAEAVGSLVDAIVLITKKHDPRFH